MSEASSGASPGASSGASSGGRKSGLRDFVRLIPNLLKRSLVGGKESLSPYWAHSEKADENYFSTLIKRNKQNGSLDN